MVTLHHPFKFGPGECCCPCWSFSDNFNRVGTEDTGWLSPSSSGEFDDGDTSWSDAANVYTDNNAYATVSVSSATTSKYLLAYNFGAAVPAGSTIVGIEIRVHRKAEVDDSIKDRGVYVHTNGALVLSGDNKASAAAWDDSEEEVLYGASDDFWTLGLLPADVNSANFGCAISVEGLLAAEKTAYIDQIEMKIWWTNPISTDVGPNWEEIVGDWGVNNNHLAEKHGGGGTANARLIAVPQMPTGSKNEFSGYIGIYYPIPLSATNNGDTFYLYMCLPNEDSESPYVKAEYMNPDVGGYNWRITVVAGGETATADMLSAGSAHDGGLLFLLSGCVEPWDYEDITKVNVTGTISPRTGASDVPWLDDVTLTPGRIFGVGHDNSTNGAVMDNFYAIELMADKLECASCFCRCNEKVMLTRELTATFYDATGDATCLEGEQFDLDWEWNAGTDRWYGSRVITYSCGAVTFAFEFRCGEYDPEDPFAHLSLSISVSNCCSDPAGCASRDAETISTCDPMHLFFGESVPFSFTGLACCLCDRHPMMGASGTVKVCVSRRGATCNGPTVASRTMLVPRALDLEREDTDTHIRMILWLEKRGIGEEYFDEILKQFGPPPKVGCSASDWLRRVKEWVKQEGNHGNQD